MTKQTVHAITCAALAAALAAAGGCAGSRTEGPGAADPGKAVETPVPPAAAEPGPVEPAGAQEEPQPAAAAPAPPAEAPWKEAAAKGMTLSWKVEEGKLLRVKVKAPTTGWVAVGFDPEKGMKGANIVIGYVKDGVAVAEDHFGSGAVAHKADTKAGGTDDVTGVGGSEADGATELSFSIPLDSGDARDKPLVEGSQYKVILAHGAKDKLSLRHSSVAIVQVTL